MTIFLYALLRNLRSKSNLLTLCIIPLIVIMIKPLWGNNNANGFSLLAVTILFASFSLVRFIMTERIEGTIIRIFAAPVTMLQYLSQNLGACLLLINIKLVVLMTVGSLLYQWNIKMVIALFLCYSVFAAAAITFSLAWYTLFRNKEVSDAIFSMVITFMCILGGIFIPITELPNIVQRIGMLLPTYWLSNGLLFLKGGEVNGDYWISIFMMILYTIIFLIFGSRRTIV